MIEVSDNTYWSHNGRHQLAYDLLNQLLVPQRNKAETMHGELLRCLGNIYYDCYNNGGCNLDNRKDEVEFIQSHLSDLTSPEDRDAIRNVIERLMTHANGLQEDSIEDCAQCGGEGEHDCNRCAGEGTIESSLQSGNDDDDEEDCPECSGSGAITCSECFGSGTYTVERSMYLADGWEAGLEKLADAVIAYVAKKQIEIGSKKQTVAGGAV